MTAATRSWGLDTDRTAPWQTRGDCARRDPRWWETPLAATPESVAAARQAIAICQTCPVRGDCNDDAQKTVGNRAGTIRAGEVYDDAGKAAPRCSACKRPLLTGSRSGSAGQRCEAHLAYYQIQRRRGEHA